MYSHTESVCAYVPLRVHACVCVNSMKGPALFQKGTWTAEPRYILKEIPIG